MDHPLRHSPILTPDSAFATSNPPDAGTTAPARPHDLPSALLDWYDVHARDLPWRVPPALGKQGHLADPYRVWLSEIMLQQTTVAAVGRYFVEFTRRWPDIAALAAEQDEVVMAAWAGLGYYARARNLLACARQVTLVHGGLFPSTEAELLKLPGIGPYTAAAIAAIAFGRQAAVLDGNIERVLTRLHGMTIPPRDNKPALRSLAGDLIPAHRPGDHAQAAMDLGATICTPRNPACGRCPLALHCVARASGIADKLPVRRATPDRPTRNGIALVLRRQDGAILTIRRPKSGLLGGMLSVPTSGWDDSPPLTVPADARVLGEVRHTFTHFHLRMQVLLAPAEPRQKGDFLPVDTESLRAFPGLMRKVLQLALAEP